MVLEAVAREKKEIGVTELSKKIGLDKSTTFRMLNTLEYYDYLIRNKDTAKYHLGIKIMELNRALVKELNLRNKARPFLEELMKKTQETVYLGILHEGEIFYLDSVECSQSLRMITPDFGVRISPHSSAMGKAIIAHLTEKEVKTICLKKGLTAYTNQTITDVETLKRELAKIRKLGYSVDDRENGNWGRCVAAPVRDRTGKVIAAVSVSAPAERLDLRAVKEMSGLVIETCDNISRSLGYQE